MRFHYVWLLWSSAFLIPWLVLFAANGGGRRAMWQTSAVTAVFGLTEPIFVPRYWNPPSLFDLAQRTGFDVESLIFSFAIGGIGVVLYNAVTRRDIVPMAPEAQHDRRHRWHREVLWVPVFLFIPLYVLPWNPIYAAVVSLALGAIAAAFCRPDLAGKTVIGSLLFLLLYWAFMLALRWSAPGYIESVWNLRGLSGVVVGGVPLEELLFGFTFGAYWSSVYEHLTWHRGARHRERPDMRHPNPTPPATA